MSYLSVSNHCFYKKKKKKRKDFYYFYRYLRHSVVIDIELILNCF